MSDVIPSHFPDWLARWTIGYIPKADRHATRAAADAWARSAEHLTTVTLPHLERLKQLSAEAIQGEAGEAIQRQLKTEIANTRNQIEFADGLATLLYDFANAVELELYIIIGIAAVLLANLLIDTAVPMKAANDRIAADIAATAARRDTLTFVFQRIAAFTERFPHMALAIRAAIVGAVSMGGVVAGAQEVQIIQGHGKPGRRTNIDGGQIRAAVTIGLIGGIAGSLTTQAMLAPLTRITGRVVAVMLASAAGGAAGGAAAAAVTGGNAAETMMMGVGSGLIGGLGTAIRVTRAISAARPPEGTVPEIGRSRGSRDDLPVRSTPDSTRPGISADAPRSRGETIPEIGGSQHNSSREALPVRPEPERVSQHSTHDGHAPWPHKETIAEIKSLEAEINRIGESLEGKFRELDEGGTPPPSDPDQPPPGRPQASPGNKPDPSHGSSPWDKGLQDIITGNLQAAPAEPPMAAPGSSPSTNHPGTAQYQSGRPDSPQMKLSGRIVAEEGQPSATPGSVLTLNAKTHAESNTYIGTAKDLGSTGGGNEPGVTAGPPVSHGDSPSGGGSGPRPPATGEGPGKPPSDEEILLDLDIFDYEPVPNEPVTPTGNSPTATPHAAGTAPVEPVPGSGTGPTPPATPTEAKSPTAQAGTTPGPASPPATPAPTPGPNTPHATPQSNTPPPQATPKSAHANSPQQPHTATPIAGAAANNLAAQVIPPTALAGAAALSGHQPSNPDAATGLSTPLPATSGGQPITETDHPDTAAEGSTKPLGAPNSDPATDSDEPTADPEEFPTPPGTTWTDPRDHNLQTNPAEHNVWQNPRDHNVQKTPAGDYVTIPGVTYPLDNEVPDRAIPIIPHTPSLTPIDLPADSARFTPAPQNTDDNNADPTPTRPPEVTPLPRDSATYPSHQDAVPETPDTPILPTKYALESNPEAPGAPQKPAGPQLNPHSFEYNPRESGVPTIGGVPHLQPAAALPRKPVERKRLTTRAQATMGDDPGKHTRKKRKPSEKTPPPPPQSSQENAAAPAAPIPGPPTPKQSKPKRSKAQATADRAVRTALREWPHTEQVDTAAQIAAALVLQALTRPDFDSRRDRDPRVSASIHGTQGNRWALVEISDGNGDMPTRSQDGKPGWPAIDSMIEKTEASGYELPRGAGKTVWFKLFEAAGDEDPSHAMPDPDVDLVFAPGTVEQGAWQARREIRDKLRQAGLEDGRVDDVLSVVSDAMQNVARYVPDSDAQVRVWRTGRVEIGDNSQNLPRPQEDSDTDAFADEEADEWDLGVLLPGTHGRFFREMVGQLAKTWGVNLERAGGKTIWFDFGTTGPADVNGNYSATPPAPQPTPGEPTPAAASDPRADTTPATPDDQSDNAGDGRPSTDSEHATDLVLQRAKQGDPAAFQKLRSRHGREILEFVLEQLGVRPAKGDGPAQSVLFAQAINLAQAVNRAVFTNAERQQWVFVEGDDVTGALQRMARNMLERRLKAAPLQTSNKLTTTPDPEPRTGVPEIDTETTPHTTDDTDKPPEPSSSELEPSNHGLTDQEVEVVRMVASGMSNKAIADRLDRSESRVKFYLKAIGDKLGIHGRHGIVNAARASGIVGDEDIAESFQEIPSGILTEQEVKVLDLVADGMSNKDIGVAMGLSWLTVKAHLARIGGKLGTGDRAGMVARALHARILPVTDPGHALGHNVLTEAEIEMLALVAEGMTNKEIGVVVSADVVRSPDDVKEQLNRIGDKLGIRERAGMVGRALRAGILPPADPVAEEPAPMPGRDVLSETEFEILSLVAEGLTNRQIGEARAISPATVRSLLLRIGFKLRAHDRTAMVEAALNRGIVLNTGVPASADTGYGGGFGSNGPSIGGPVNVEDTNALVGEQGHTPHNRGGSATDAPPPGPITHVHDSDTDRAAHDLPQQPERGGGGGQAPGPETQFYNDVDPAVDHGFFKRRKVEANWVLNNFGPVNPGPQKPNNAPTSGAPPETSDREWGRPSGTKEDLDRARADLAELLGIDRGLLQSSDLLRSAVDTVQRQLHGRDDAVLNHVASEEKLSKLKDWIASWMANQAGVDAPGRTAAQISELMRRKAYLLAQLPEMLGLPKSSAWVRSREDPLTELRLLSARATEASDFAHLVAAIERFLHLESRVGWDASRYTTTVDIAHAFSEKNPMAVFGFSGLDLVQAREFVETVHELLDLFPIHLMGISAVLDDAEGVYADAEPLVDDEAVSAFLLTLRIGETADSTIPPGDIRNAVIRGFGEAMMIAGRWRAVKYAMGELQKLYRRTCKDQSLDGFNSWLHEQFDELLFFDEDLLLPKKALRESFAKVYQGLPEATAGQQVLHQLLIDKAKKWDGRSDLALRGPSTPMEVEQLQEKMTKINELKSKLGIEAHGLDMIDVEVETVEEIVNEVLFNHEDLGLDNLGLSEICIRPNGDEACPAQVEPTPEGSRLIVSEKWAINRYMQYVSNLQNIIYGWMVGSRDEAMRNTIGHEMGHVVQAFPAGHESEDWLAVFLEIIELFEYDNPTRDLDQFKSWLESQIGKYIYDSDGNLKLAEIFAEGYNAVRWFGDHAKEVPKILRNHLVKEALREAERRRGGTSDMQTTSGTNTPLLSADPHHGPEQSTPQRSLRSGKMSSAEGSSKDPQPASHLVGGPTDQLPDSSETTSAADVFGRPTVSVEPRRQPKDGGGVLPLTIDIHGHPSDDWKNLRRQQRQGLRGPDIVRIGDGGATGGRDDDEVADGTDPTTQVAMPADTALPAPPPTGAANRPAPWTKLRSTGANTGLNDPATRQPTPGPYRKATATDTTPAAAHDATSAPTTMARETATRSGGTETTDPAQQPDERIPEVDQPGVVDRPVDRGGRKVSTHHPAARQADLDKAPKVDEALDLPRHRREAEPWAANPGRGVPDQAFVFARDPDGQDWGSASPNADRSDSADSMETPPYVTPPQTTASSTPTGPVESLFRDAADKIDRSGWSLEAREAGKRLMRLLFDLTKVEQGKVWVEPTDDDIGPLLTVDSSEGDRQLTADSIPGIPLNGFTLVAREFAYRQGVLRSWIDDMFGRSSAGDYQMVVGAVLEELAAQLGATGAGWLQVTMYRGSDGDCALSADFGKHGVDATAKLELELKVPEGGELADAKLTLTMWVDSEQDPDSVITGVSGVVRELTAGWLTDRSDVARDATERLLRAETAGRDDPAAAFGLRITAQWKRSDQAARRERSGQLNLVICDVRGRPKPRGGTVFDAMTVADDDTVDTVVAEVCRRTRADMAWYWTNSHQLDAAEAEVAWYLRRAMAGIRLDRVRWFDLTVAEEPNTKIRTVTVRATAKRSGDSQGAVGLDLHWYTEAESVDVGGTFGTTDQHAYAEWVVYASADADPVVVPRHTDKSILQALGDRPSVKIRVQKLVGAVIDMELVKPGRPGLVRVAVTGDEFRVVVAHRGPATSVAGRRVQDLLGPGGATRVAVLPWSNGGTMIVAAFNLLPSANVQGDHGWPAGRPRDSTRLNPRGTVTRINTALGEHNPPVPDSSAPTRALDLRNVDAVRASIDALLSQHPSTRQGTAARDSGQATDEPEVRTRDVMSPGPAEIATTADSRVQRPERELADPDARQGTDDREETAASDRSDRQGAPEPVAEHAETALAPPVLANDVNHPPAHPAEDETEPVQRPERVRSLPPMGGGAVPPLDTRLNDRPLDDWKSLKHQQRKLFDEHLVRMDGGGAARAPGPGPTPGHPERTAPERLEQHTDDTADRSLDTADRNPTLGTTVEAADPPGPQAGLGFGQKPWLGFHRPEDPLHRESGEGPHPQQSPPPGVAPAPAADAVGPALPDGLNHDASNPPARWTPTPSSNHQLTTSPAQESAVNQSRRTPWSRQSASTRPTQGTPPASSKTARAGADSGLEKRQTRGLADQAIEPAKGGLTPGVFTRPPATTTSRSTAKSGGGAPTPGPGLSFHPHVGPNEILDVRPGVPTPGTLRAPNPADGIGRPDMWFRWNPEQNPPQPDHQKANASAKTPSPEQPAATEPLMEVTDRATHDAPLVADVPLEAALGRLGDRVARASLLLGRDAVDAAFGERIRTGSRLEVSVPEEAYRYLRGQTEWTETQAADGTARLVNAEMSIGMGWNAGPLHDELLRRSWKTPAGIHVASLPDVYAVLQERGLPQDLLDAEAIRRKLLDPTQPPLPEHVLAREISAMRSVLPTEALDHLDADVVVRLGANGMHICSTLYGDPAIGRANQIIGDLELAEYRVPATYHNGFGLVEDGRLLQEHLGNIGARPHERLDAAAADTYSDAVYGNGRRSNNPEGYDELRSANLARAHALSLGYEPDRADRIHRMIMGTGFTEGTGDQAGRDDPDPLVRAMAGVDLQTLVQPSSLEDTAALAPENLASKRYKDERILGRTLVDHDLRIRSIEEAPAIFDEYADYRPRIDGVPVDRNLMDALSACFAGDAVFRRKHQFPRDWTLDNRQLRADHNRKAEELSQKLADREISAARAYEQIRRHTAVMQEKMHDNSSKGRPRSATSTFSLAGTQAARDVGRGESPATRPIPQRKPRAGVPPTPAQIADALGGIDKRRVRGMDLDLAITADTGRWHPEQLNAFGKGDAAHPKKPKATSDAPEPVSHPAGEPNSPVPQDDTGRRDDKRRKFLQWIRPKSRRKKTNSGNKNLSQLYLGNAAATASDAGRNAIVPSLVYELSGSAELTGLMMSATSLAGMITQPLGGREADRDARRAIILGLAGQLVAVGGAGVWLGAGLSGAVPVLFVAAVGAAAANSFVEYGTMVYGERLAETKEQKENSIILQLVNSQGSTAAGEFTIPAIVSVSPALAYGVNAASYVVFLGALRSIPPLPPKKYRARLIDGFRAIRGDRYLLGLTALQFPSMVGVGVVGVQFAHLLATADYSVTTKGLLVSATSTGFVAIAKYAKRISKYVDITQVRPLVLVGLGVYAGTIASTTNPLAIWSVDFALGATMMIGNKKFFEYQAEVVPEESIGGVRSTSGFVVRAGAVVGAAVGGVSMSMASSTTVGLWNAGGFLGAAVLSGILGFRTRHRSDRQDAPEPIAEHAETALAPTVLANDVNHPPAHPAGDETEPVRRPERLPSLPPMGGGAVPPPDIGFDGRPPDDWKSVKHQMQEQFRELGLFHGDGGGAARAPGPGPTPGHPHRTAPERLEQVREALALAKRQRERLAGLVAQTAELWDEEPGPLDAAREERWRKLHNKMRTALAIAADDNAEQAVARAEAVRTEGGRHVEFAEQFPLLDTLVRRIEQRDKWARQAELLAAAADAYNKREQARTLRDDAAAELRGPHKDLAPDTPRRELERERDDLHAQLADLLEVDSDELDVDRVEDVLVMANRPVGDPQRPADADTRITLGSRWLEFHQLVENARRFDEYNAEAQRLDALADTDSILAAPRGLETTDTAKRRKPVPTVQSRGKGEVMHARGFTSADFATLSPSDRHAHAMEEIAYNALTFKSNTEAAGFAHAHIGDPVATVSERGPVDWTSQSRRLPRHVVVTFALQLDDVDADNPESLLGALLPITGNSTAVIVTSPWNRSPDNNIGVALVPAGTLVTRTEDDPVTGNPRLVLTLPNFVRVIRVVVDGKTTAYGFLGKPPGGHRGTTPPSGPAPAQPHQNTTAKSRHQPEIAERPESDDRQANRWFHTALLVVDVVVVSLAGAGLRDGRPMRGRARSGLGSW